MSFNLKDQVKQLVWELIEEEYNVDRREPHLLTAKKILSGNQIDRIGEKIATVVEQIIIETAANYSKQSDETSQFFPEEVEVKNDYTPDEEDDPYSEYGFFFYQNPND